VSGCRGGGGSAGKQYVGGAGIYDTIWRVAAVCIDVQGCARIGGDLDVGRNFPGDESAEIMSKETNRLLFAVDMAGTLLFGIEGATAAIAGNLDLLGVMVLAFATALGGGIIRDLLIGATPPAALRDWRYSATAFTGGMTVFFLHHYVVAIPMPVMVVLDAAALALFAIAGTEKALLFNVHPFIAILLGGITAVGGGTIRDIFLAHVPSVLRSEVYATAALLGSALMIAARKLRLSPTQAAVVGGAACFLLRVISVWQHWNLPKAISN
jgi:uncharacterized membrane protein YeiH